jgi:hypothetical protein
MTLGVVPARKATLAGGRYDNRRGQLYRQVRD